MKIANISDDGRTISQHFGRAPYYVVVTVEDGKVLGKETRDKAGHHTFAATEVHTEHQSGQPHGYDAASQDRHTRMAGSIADCQVLLAGGMGRGAYDSLQARGIKTIITDIRDVDAAVAAYLDGSIRDLAAERLH